MLKFGFNFKNKLPLSHLECLLLCFLLGFCLPSYGQESSLELDLAAPTIEVSPVEEAPPNKSLMISAKVQDNRQVDKVTLFYRSSREKNFKRLPMNRGGKGDVYFANLDSALVRSPSIAYYIQANDQAGNSVMYGYNFAPKIIRIHEAANSQNSDLKLGSLDGQSKKRSKSKKGAMKWLWIGLGAVAVGAAASANGGDSVSGLPADDDDTGTVTIVAPVP